MVGELLGLMELSGPLECKRARDPLSGLVPTLIAETRILYLDVWGHGRLSVRMGSPTVKPRVVDVLYRRSDGVCEWNHYRAGEAQSEDDACLALASFGFSKSVVDGLVRSDDWGAASDRLGLHDPQSKSRVLAGIRQWPGCPPEIVIELEARESRLATLSIAPTSLSERGNFTWSMDDVGYAWFHQFVGTSSYPVCAQGLDEAKKVLIRTGFKPDIVDIAFANLASGMAPA